MLLILASLGSTIFTSFGLAFSTNSWYNLSVSAELPASKYNLS
jgi:hypothetical protein